MLQRLKFPDFGITQEARNLKVLICLQAENGEVDLDRGDHGDSEQGIVEAEEKPEGVAEGEADSENPVCFGREGSEVRYAGSIGMFWKQIKLYVLSDGNVSGSVLGVPLRESAPCRRRPLHKLRG